MTEQEIVKSVFYINNRFMVDPAANRLTDLSKNEESRLEPRIMALLCMLSAKPYQTIKREELITVIWNDYGGGDEGLTQGISALRKLLSDDNKDLIQTIPKKGYSLKARISKEQGAKRRSKIRRLLIIASIVLLSVFIVLYLLTINYSEPVNHPYTEVGFPGNDPAMNQDEENETNTIVTYGEDSIKYKLVMIGDRPPVFYVADTILPVHKWDNYMPLINRLKTELKNRGNRSE
jgi:DNA-binding winged helix-turn-helix (wHTH) protein